MAKSAMSRAGTRYPAREFTEQAGASAAEELLTGARLPTAVFAGQRPQSPSASSTASTGRALQVPRDVSVVGFDNTFVAELSHIRLTTINQPRHEMGREALALVLERADGRTRGATRLHRPELVVRASTAPPR
jgi:DNA-binding LacI/PurR family transcriptional regulator